MPFKSLFSVPCLSVDYDSHRDCLSLNLWGQLEVVELQDINLQIAGIMPAYPAWCLVQDNLTPTERGLEAEDWLFDQLLPAFHRAGVRHWTWVCGPTLRSRLLAEQVAKRLPQVVLTVFNDLEQAATWLQRFR